TRMELLDQGVVPNASVVVNSGTLNLGQGGDFQGLASITNTGTIDVQGGVLNVLVDVANSDGETDGQITVEEGATLALGTDPNNTAGVTGGITGGTVIIKGTLELTGGNFLKNGALENDRQINVDGFGNSFDHETVTANNALEIFAGGALTIDQGSTVANTGGVTIDNSATLTVNDASISGGIVTNLSGGTIALTGSAVLKNGSLGNAGQILVSGTQNALDHEIVTNDSAFIEITGVLVLDLGTSIAGGTLSNS